MKKIVLISMIGLLLFGCGQSEQIIKEDNQAKQTEQSDKVKNPWTVFTQNKNKKQIM